MKSMRQRGSGTLDWARPTVWLPVAGLMVVTAHVGNLWARAALFLLLVIGLHLALERLAAHARAAEMVTLAGMLDEAPGYRPLAGLLLARAGVLSRRWVPPLWLLTRWGHNTPSVGADGSPVGERADSLP